MTPAELDMWYVIDKPPKTADLAASLAFSHAKKVAIYLARGSTDLPRYRRIERVWVAQ